MAITHSAKETRQQKEQWGWRLEATGKVGLDRILKKRGREGGRVDNIGKVGGGGGSLRKIVRVRKPLPTIVWILLVETFHLNLIYLKWNRGSFLVWQLRQ